MQYLINKSREETEKRLLKGSNNAYIQLLKIPFFNELYELKSNLTSAIN